MIDGDTTCWNRESRVWRLYARDSRLSGALTFLVRNRSPGVPGNVPSWKRHLLERPILRDPGPDRGIETVFEPRDELALASP